jgi:predicted RNA binding protein YcfA (HicA-like mRNA interferase family)
MKRRDLLRLLRKNGCVLLRSGGNHDIYVNAKTGKKQPVPRHDEIDEILARHILRYLGFERSGS